ncbi:MAG: UvrD-helicase domain-containing protein, partial [bacterium]|nr:UvrD-helicase domain-containing protein [bacterium]
MLFYADLHTHSKYSRATSRQCDLEHFAWWARRKGLTVVGTGDFTHPAWFDELREKLVAAEPGLFRLRPELEREVERTLPASCHGPVRFMLEVEISTIYKAGERTRKVHHLIYAAELDTASRLRDRLARIGNIASDGRPILGLDSRHLLEITLESGADAYLVPAHIWTPWFAVLGSKSGFDAVEECYGDLAEHIFAVETGLSSDPPMNWRVSQLDRYRLVSNSDAHSPPVLGREACVFDTELDYFAMRRALETGDGYGGTVEFFPEEGKYHLDGHRACGVRLEPGETREHGGRCPACGKPVTVGVLHRVEALADRPAGEKPRGTSPYRSFVQLPEILAELHGVGSRSKTVERTVAALVGHLGPELEILGRIPLEDVERTAGTLLAEAIRRLRASRVRCEGGYDGEYGTIRLFEPQEITPQLSLFGELRCTPPPAAARRRPVEPSTTAADASAPSETGPSVRPAPGEGPRSILDALDADQRAAAEIVDGPLLIIAGPGTGKTRTLTHRIAHLITRGAAPEACLALTFTRRAAAEMRDRLEELLPGTARRIPVTTFHGLGLGIVRENHSALGLPRGVRVADDATRRELVAAGFGVSKKEAGQLIAELIAARQDQASPRLDAGTLQAYRETLRERALVDFEDLLVLPIRLLSEQPELLAAYRARYRWISIDEYQDIDACQYQLVRLLAAAGGDVCAIGDPDQSIYRFRGADVGFFLRFREDYPGARVVQLGRNYRSQRVIVDAALQAIAPSSLVAERRLETVLEGAPERIVLHEAASERAEAEFVVQAIEELLGGTSYFSVDSGRVRPDLDAQRTDLSFDDFAVLYRTHAQAAPLVEAFDRAGMPFQQRSHERLVERAEVRLLLQALEVLADGEPSAAASVPDWLAIARERVGTSSDRSALDAAIELLTPLAERHGEDLDAFLTALALGAEVDTWDPRAERVSLLTLHAAKGLEFPVVFVVGCEEGILPFTWTRGEVDWDEERRLLFVGMTRARSRLFLSLARRRYGRGAAR